MGSTNLLMANKPSESKKSEAPINMSLYENIDAVFLNKAVINTENNTVAYIPIAIINAGDAPIELSFHTRVITNKA